ncbi:thioesterase-like superfamily-domain-containing protein [Phascolomyces articulosus]|uniref:Thioesterase-like superfamily-domain-containing protein n=1 Tax=Phascolomyces articulosus TaxID=60185 RepID=A0AAD5JY98_9FUNG|nr:thioesterase-like superfamily-domain-containing protein [Phascolomyces articulosus]
MLKATETHYSNRSPISVTTNYLSETLPGPCIIEVNEIRKTRCSLCTITATMKQHSSLTTRFKRKDNQQSLTIPPPPSSVDKYEHNDYNVKCYAIIILGSEFNKKYNQQQGQQSSIPTIIHPNACTAPSIEMMEPVQIVYDNEITLEILMDLSRKKEKNSAEAHHAISFLDGRPIDSLALSFFAAVFRHPLNTLTGRQDLLGNETTWKPTFQMDVQFKNPIPPNTRYVLATIIAPHLIEGRFDTDGWIFSPDGTLLATAKHHGLVIPRSQRQGITAEKPITWDIKKPSSSPRLHSKL